jgi:hypothetical protein
LFNNVIFCWIIIPKDYGPAIVVGKGQFRNYGNMSWVEMENGNNYIILKKLVKGKLDSWCDAM